MRENLIYPIGGTPILDWIRDIHFSLDDDQVSLSNLLNFARGYGLDPEETLEFARRCMRNLLDAWAIPVVFMKEGDYMFGRTDRFGTERDEIVEAIIADWQKRGGGDLEWGEYPFTFPENLTLLR